MSDENGATCLSTDAAIEPFPFPRFPTTVCPKWRELHSPAQVVDTSRTDAHIPPRTCLAKGRSEGEHAGVGSVRSKKRQKGADW